MEATFRRARAGGRKLLVPYVTGGLGGWEDAIRAAAAMGADGVEIGLPFSDPVMDGPVIQTASQRALEEGITPMAVIDAVARIDAGIPVAVMCYYNTVFRAGHERFAKSLAAAGIAGAIVPDLPLEESGAVLEACDAVGVALVPLVAPTTPDERMARIGARARGFVYTVSVVGTTGERAALDDRLGGVLARAASATSVPVAVGFGIGTPQQAAAAADAGAAGVIVGSRLVRAAAEAESPANEVRELVRAMADALR
jgi:tryptophan synthase alpha chain